MSTLFPTSSLLGSGLGADPAAAVVWNDVGVGIIPIGGICAWAKNLHGGIPPLLPQFVQCDGQVLADTESPLDGVTIPDLNGGGRFLSGAAASGGTGGATTHNHNITNRQQIFNAGTGYNKDTNSNHLPPYYQVVWVMRIK